MGQFVMRTLLTVGLIVGFGLPQSALAGDKGAEDAARELMEVTGGGEIGIQVMRHMLDTLGADNDIPPEFIEAFKQLAKPEDLVALVIPIYAKHLDEKTMRAAVAFYTSPEGRKLIEAMPAITAESQAAGEQWGANLAEEVMKALLEKE